MHSPDDVLADSSQEESNSDASDDEYTFVLSRKAKGRTKLHHPPASHIKQLWQAFVTNVDPLTKVVHVPSVKPAIDKAASDTQHIPRGFEALMFAIYSMAILSMTDLECRQKFNKSRRDLLARYVAGTKAALARANFMATISLVVLQALILHLFSVRSIYEPRAMWALTGVAVRIGQCMGLDRDGSSLGLPPFEVELRRRIWWLLKTHDFRTAELCGLPKFRDMDTGPNTTKWPTNVDDDELTPSMSEAPVESKSMTDFVFHAVRYELTKLAVGVISKFRESGKEFDQWDLRATGEDRLAIEFATSELGEVIEVKYLRYCDPTQPLHLLLMIMARSALNNIIFLMKHPRRWGGIENGPPDERELIWQVSVKHLEQHDMVQSSPQLRQFSWHSAYFMLWHCFIHVLDALRAQPLLRGADKAWSLVDRTYENNPDILVDMRKPIHVAIGNLCIRAFEAREIAFEKDKLGPVEPPECVVALRQQRQEAQAKKVLRDARKSQARPEDQTKADEPSIAELGGPHNYHDDDGQPQFSVLHGDVGLQVPDGMQPQYEGGSDPFWYLNGLNDNQLGDINDVMDLDPDFLLSENFDVNRSNSRSIGWDQWDAWLAESNTMRPMAPG